MTTSPPDEPAGPGATPDEPDQPDQSDLDRADRTADLADRSPDPLLDPSRDPVLRPPDAGGPAGGGTPPPPPPPPPPVTPPAATSWPASPPASPSPSPPPPPPPPPPGSAGPVGGGLPPAWGAQPGAVPPPPPGYPPPGATSRPGFPPPPAGYVPAAGRGAATLSAGDAVSYAIGAFRRNALQLILIAVVIAAIQGLFELAQQGIENDAARAFVGLAALVVTWMLTLGLVQAALAVLDGRQPDVSMLFSSPKLGAYLLGALLAGVAVAVGFVLCLVPGIILLFLFQLWGYALVDGPRSDPVEAIKASVAVVRANVGSVLVLDLLIFIVWFAVFVVLTMLTVFVPVLGFLALVATGILVYPVSSLALAYAWRRLTGGVIAPVA